MEEYHNVLGDKALMTPHFVMWNCPLCDAMTKENDCYGDGEYCAFAETCKTNFLEFRVS
jgi:hypothetical protein